MKLLHNIDTKWEGLSQDFLSTERRKDQVHLLFPLENRIVMWPIAKYNFFSTDDEYQTYRVWFISVHDSIDAYTDVANRQKKYLSIKVVQNTMNHLNW